MSQAVDEDREELARFREEWKKEVERKKNPQPEPGPSKQRPELNVLAEYDLSETTSSGTATPGPSSETISGTPAALATGSKYFDASNVPPAIRTALAIYTRAVQHEQSGQLDTALSLYRQAFRLEPNVDRAYHTQEILASIKAAQTTDLSSPKDGENVDHLATTLQRAVAIKSGEEPVLVVTGTLASLLEGFPQDLVFEPEDEEQPVYINVLPEELLIIILRKLDHTSIERFAAVSRKARVLSLDPGIWRSVCCVTIRDVFEF
jgi:F-box protein 9